MLSPRLIEHTNHHTAYDWPSHVIVQGGERGVVFAAAGDYVTAFVEAFTTDTFIRGEGPDLAAAEQACWAKYQTLMNCPHPGFEPRRYTNGSGYCVACGTWFPQRVTGLPITADPEPTGLLARVAACDADALVELADRANAAIRHG